MGKALGAGYVHTLSILLLAPDAASSGRAGAEPARRWFKHGTLKVFGLLFSSHCGK